MFSESIVEKKRYHRTLVAVINGTSAVNAIDKGLVEEQEATQLQEHEVADSYDGTGDDHEMFVPARVSVDEKPSSSSFSSPFNNKLNPDAATFFPQVPSPSSSEQKVKQPGWLTNFGSQDRSPDSPGAPPSNIFGQVSAPTSQTSALPSFPSANGISTTPFKDPASADTVPKSVFTGDSTAPATQPQFAVPSKSSSSQTTAPSTSWSSLGNKASGSVAGAAAKPSFNFNFSSPPSNLSQTATSAVPVTQTPTNEASISLPSPKNFQAHTPDLATPSNESQTPSVLPKSNFASSTKSGKLKHGVLFWASHFYQGHAF